jgi:hypothetical protein
MITLHHKSESRGGADYGWLNTKHNFSFSNYYDPQRTQFGALRVLNDDIVEPGYGFGTHGHENMEIISIPLQGELAHKDSTGRSEIIRTGEVQIMSAGTGIRHSEFNPSPNDRVNFLQIWILPKEKNIQPRYEQKKFSVDSKKNRFLTTVSPSDKNSVWINQDAYLSLGEFDKDNIAEYTLQKQGNGIFLFTIKGKFIYENIQVGDRDSLGVESVSKIELKFEENTELLVIEVPMN